MRKLILNLAISLLPLSLTAQLENALYFDNIDDHVTVPNASAPIANSGALSLTMWVYPENTFPSYPDLDGFAGFRNNIDADFYLIQISPTEVEARFRNGLGTVHDIVFNGLLLNTWQHFALIYDGLALTLYHNGVVAGTTSASGTIGSTTETFYMGMTPWTSANFNLNGKLDEVSLWSKSLSAAEVTCSYNGALDPSSGNLKLYYRFNQGIPGGNNGTVNTLIDATGTINGVLNGFALAGNTSNWVTGIPASNSTTITDVICPGAVYIFGGQVLTSPGTYFDVFPNPGGCDSVVQLVLTTVAINTTISQAGPVLTSMQQGAAYQWIDCLNGNSPIPGATNQVYTATANGQYAVIVTLGGCSDTTLCAAVTNVGLNEISNNLLVANPNPFYNLITIDFPREFINKKIIVTDISGRLIYEANNQSGRMSITTTSWEAGVYFITAEGLPIMLRVIKE